MPFQAPLLLVSLALVPLVAIAYVVAQRRRRRFAVHYTNVDLLASVAGRAWSRHVPALLALLALAAMLVALARPQHTVAAERRDGRPVRTRCRPPAPSEPRRPRRRLIAGPG